jgi:putative ABC transport system substrate-binding protein
MTRVLMWLCLTVGCVALVRGDALAQDRPDLDWLVYDRSTLDDYDITIGADDPARNLAVPRAGADLPMKQVLLLIPSPSVEAYSLAVNTILRGFNDAGVPARFEIWYYNKNDEVAEEALHWAYTQPVDLIMSVGSSATSFLAEHHTGHKIPAVTSASKDPVASGHVSDAARGSGTNIAYTSINVETDTLVAYLRRLVPGLTTVGLLYATDNSSAVLTQVNPLRAAAGRLGLKLVDITVSSSATASEELETGLPAGVAHMRRLDPGLSNSVLLVTGSTSVYERIDIINRHADALPVISMLPDIVRAGDESALLSIGVNLTSALKLSTVYALDVITGKANPGILPVGSVSPPDLAINFRVAERVGVKIPFSFLESSTFVYDLAGVEVIAFGQRVADRTPQTTN